MLYIIWSALSHVLCNVARARTHAQVQAKILPHGPHTHTEIVCPRMGACHPYAPPYAHTHARKRAPCYTFGGSASYKLVANILDARVQAAQAGTEHLYTLSQRSERTENIVDIVCTLASARIATSGPTWRDRNDENITLCTAQAPARLITMKLN